MCRKPCSASLRTLPLCASHSSAAGGLHNNPIAGKFLLVIRRVRKPCFAILWALPLCASRSRATGELHNNPIAGKFFACNMTRAESLAPQAFERCPFALPHVRASTSHGLINAEAFLSARRCGIRRSVSRRHDSDNH